MKKILPILFLLLCLSGHAQRDPYLDSLWKAWSDVKQSDTARLKAMYDFAWDGFLFSQPDSCYYFSKQMYDFAVEKGQKEFQAKALNLQFNYYLAIGDYAKALEKNNESFAIRKQIDDKLGLAVSCSNYGILYQIQGDFSKAIDYFILSLKYNEEVGNRNGVSVCLHNIGHLYQDQLDYKKAIEYYERSLKIREEINDVVGIATSQLNIGSVYQQLGEFEKAMEYSEKSLTLNRKLDNKIGIAGALGNIGMTYQGIGDNAKALDYYLQSLKIQEEIGNKLTIAISLANIGSIHLEMNDVANAISFTEKALKISQDIGDAVGIKGASLGLFRAFKKAGRYQEALQMHELYVQMLDSINSEESKKELVRQEFKYEYEKKAVADSIRATEEKKVIAAQFKQEQTQRYALYIGLVLLVVFGGFMFNRYRISQKQKHIIEDQKQIVEQKQSEILDSIHYARKIQQSLLPNEKYIDKHLKRLINKKENDQ